MVAGWSALVDQARASQWYDGTGPQAIECMSVTKFVVAMALGLTVSVDDLRVPLRTWIGEWAEDAAAT